jgi:hypothetical protein
MLDPAVPFGGVKQSGYGRESGPEALQAYTRSKSVVISLVCPLDRAGSERPAAGGPSRPDRP